MHMCMVAAAVGADGVMQEPILLREVQAPSGATRMTWESRVYRKAMEADIAAVMQNYMRYVVTSGTGSRAGTRSMIICGKTGTAESTLKGKPVNYGWFVGYVDGNIRHTVLCPTPSDLIIPAGKSITLSTTACRIPTAPFVICLDNSVCRSVNSKPTKLKAND